MTKSKPRPKATEGRSARFRRLPDRRDTTTTSMVWPIALHQRAALAAVKLNWPLVEVVRVALTEWLDKHEGRIGR